MMKFFICPCSLGRALIWSGLSFASLAIAQETSLPKPTTSSSQTVEKSSELNKEGIVLFTPPPGWRLAEADSLPAHVRVMVVGSGPSSFPPSMNLSSEPYKGTLKQYLKTVKNLNSAQGYEWKDLGSIKTAAGNASLSQVDTKSQWGDIRLMHVILIKNGHAYILTASALKDEFSIFYQAFFAAMRSLRVVHDAYEMVEDLQQRTQLKAAAAKLQSQWDNLIAQKQKSDPEISMVQQQESLFKSQQFQDEYWKPFQEMLKQKYGNLGPEWQALFLKTLEDHLLPTKTT